jgi:hypothetical protein
MDATNVPGLFHNRLKNTEEWSFLLPAPRLLAKWGKRLTKVPETLDIVRKTPMRPSAIVRGKSAPSFMRDQLWSLASLSSLTS